MSMSKHSTLESDSSNSFPPQEPEASILGKPEEGVEGGRGRGWKKDRRLEKEVVSMEDLQVSPPLTFDDFLKKVGGFGKFQKQQTLACGAVWTAFGISMIQSVFTVLSSGEIVQQWEISSFAQGALKSSVFVGTIVGTPLFGKLGDRFGRRRCLMWALLGCGLSSCLGGVAPIYSVFLVASLFLGFFGGGVGILGFVLASETWGVDERTSLGNLFHLSYTVGIAVLVMFALILGPSQSILLAFGAYIVPLLLVASAVLEESPRWLLLQLQKYRKVPQNSEHTDQPPLDFQELAEARRVLSKMGEMNSYSPQELPSLIDSLLSASPQGPSLPTDDSTLLLESPLLKKCLLVLCGVWFAASFSYYGLSMDAEHIGESVYSTTLLMGLVEVPGFLLPTFLFGRIGRVKGLAFVLFVVGLCGLGIGILPSSFQVPLALLGKLASCGCFSGVYLLSAELLPTSVRSQGTGINSTSARVAATIAPLVVTIFSALAEWIPLVVFGGVALGGSVLCAGLREPLGAPLTASVREFEGVEERWWTLRGPLGVFEWRDTHRRMGELEEGEANFKR